MSPQASWPWPPPQDDGGADHLAPGTPLPNISLPSTQGGQLSIASLPGKTVLFVYPWAGRPGHPNPSGWDEIPGAHGSTPQAEGFRDHSKEYIRRGWRIVGLSGQASAEQDEFVSRLQLPMPLLSDNELEFSAAMALPSFATDGQIFLRRLTMLIINGAIRTTIYPVHPPDSHARDILDGLPEVG